MLTQLKITVRKKERWKRTLILKRVTCVHIFFLDCSTMSNNSENDDIFIERTTRPLSTPQPLATTTRSFSHRTKLTITRNKLLSAGKIYLDGNLTCNMTLVYCSSCRMPHFQTPPTLPVHLNIYYVLWDGDERGENPMSFLAKTLALPPFYGNSCDPTHDISYRDPTVSQKIEMSSLFKETLMEILNQNQLRGNQEIQRYQHRKNTESDFFL